MRHLLTALLLTTLTAACAADHCHTDHDQDTAETAPTDGAAATEPAEPDTSPAEAWLARIEQRADDIESLTAKLRYDNNQLLLGDEQRRFGTLTYEAGPPRRFRIHFDRKIVDGFMSRPDLYYIYDGRWLLKRDHENKTAVRYQLVADDEEVADEMDLGDGPFPLPLNLKKDRVIKRFEADVIDPAEDDPENSVHLRLIPREDHQTELTQIDLWFDRDSALPLAVSSLDESETQTVVQLNETVISPELAGETFDTSLPDEPGWQTDENRIAPAEPTP
jgi:hypothetical protein